MPYEGLWKEKSQKNEKWILKFLDAFNNIKDQLCKVIEVKLYSKHDLSHLQWVSVLEDNYYIMYSEKDILTDIYSMKLIPEENTTYKCNEEPKRINQIGIPVFPMDLAFPKNFPFKS
ncbi:MAG: hypothetical protein ACTSVZ_08410 [Promethearchaeota archaeon]